jgi:hypothetical protein
MSNINPRKKCLDRPCQQLPGIRTLSARYLLLTVMVTLAGLPLSASSAPDLVAPRLSVDNSVATAGFYSLSWETGIERVELQEASEPGFDNPLTAYTGPDRASVISGKPNGTWFYRIRALDDQRAGPWSEPLSVTVAHHSLARALLFLGLGLTVFIATVLMIVRGSDKTA